MKKTVDEPNLEPAFDTTSPESIETEAAEFFSDDVLNAQIHKNAKEAEELLQDEDKMERFLQRLEKKLALVPAVGKYLTYIPLMISLVKSYATKEYQDIPIGSVIAIIGALIYFLSPVDLIPDNIPVVGYADDALVIATAWKMVGSDIEEYVKWQEKNGKRIDI